jgi:hypothetical protein
VEPGSEDDLVERNAVEVRSDPLRPDSGNLNRPASQPDLYRPRPDEKKLDLGGPAA